MMVKIVKKAEIRQRKSIIHSLRDTFGSLLIQQGESLTYVKEQMGHKSIQIAVDVYGHLIPGGNRAAVDTLDAFDDIPSASESIDLPVSRIVVSWNQTLGWLRSVDSLRQAA